MILLTRERKEINIRYLLFYAIMFIVKYLIDYI